MFVKMIIYDKRACDSQGWLTFQFQLISMKEIWALCVLGKDFGKDRQMNDNL